MSSGEVIPLDFYEKFRKKLQPTRKYIWHVCSPDIPRVSVDLTLITSRYWNSLFHSLITLGRMQRSFLQLYAFIQYQFSFHLVLITAGWTEAV